MEVILGYGTSPIEISGDYDKERFFEDCRNNMVKVGLVDHDRDLNSYTAIEESKMTIDRFLNRILGMKVSLQNTLFKYFSDTMEAYIKHAKRLGRFDRGIRELRSDMGQVEIKNSRSFSNKYGSMQTTINLHEILVNRGLTWEQALQMIADSDDSYEGFYESRADHLSRKSIVLAVRDSSNQAYRGIFRIYKPNIGQDNSPKSLNDLKEGFLKIKDHAKAEKLWKDIYDNSDKLCYHMLYHGNCKRFGAKRDGCVSGMRKQVVYVLSGSIFALWSTIEKELPSNNTKLQITRINFGDKSKMKNCIGIEIPEWSVEHLVKALEEGDQKSKDGQVEDVQIEAQLPSDSDFTDESTSY